MRIACTHFDDRRRICLSRGDGCSGMLKVHEVSACTAASRQSRTDHMVVHIQFECKRPATMHFCSFAIALPPCDDRGAAPGRLSVGWIEENLVRVVVYDLCMRWPNQGMPRGCTEVTSCRPLESCKPGRSYELKLEHHLFDKRTAYTNDDNYSTYWMHSLLKAAV